MVRSALLADAERFVFVSWYPLCDGLLNSLLAEEFLGENHPEGEQSDKGSGGGECNHSGCPSEFVVPLVCRPVVTLLFHEC